MGIPLAILLAVTIITAGFTDYAYAHSKKAKVGCYDLAIALVSWNGMYRYIDDDDLAALNKK